MVPLPEILTKRGQSVTTPRKYRIYRARYTSSHENYPWIVLQLYLYGYRIVLRFKKWQDAIDFVDKAEYTWIR